MEAMAHTADVVEVTVRSITGDAVLGPQLFSRAGVVAELRAKLLQLRRSPTGVDRVLLVCGADVLQDDNVVEGESMECTALFEHEELCEDERRRCIHSLTECSWWYHRNPYLEDLRPSELSPLDFMESDRSKALKVFSDFSDVARADAQVVKEAVHCHWQCLESAANDRLRADASIVSQACKHNGRSLTLASAELRGDKQFVLRQVRGDGKAIQGALPELCRDRDFLLQALWRNPTAIHNARFEVPDDLLMMLAEDMSETQVQESVDREEALWQVRADGLWLAKAVEFQDDKAIVLAAVEQNPHALCFTTLVDDRDVVLTAVQSNGKMLEFASEELRKDHEVVLAAMRSNPRAIRFAIDRPLFDVADAEASTQKETTARRMDERAGRSKRNGRTTRAVHGRRTRFCRCHRATRPCGCSFEP